MCKLCNTDRQPQDISKTYSKTKLSFMATASQYINQYPCKMCVSTASSNWDRNIRDAGSLDHYILRKLYIAYRPKGSYQKKKISFIATIKVVETTNKISYMAMAQLKTDKPITIGTYPALKEAIEAKIEYLVTNGAVHGLEILKNKLKELENGKN